jgi:hypothetical protein
MLQTTDLPPLSLYSDKEIFDEFMKRYQREHFREMTKKEQKHIGQQPLISEYDHVPEDRPRGMPSLSQIKAETAKLGLPDSDAAHLYDTWLVSGFRSKTGPIRSWTAAIRLWFRSGYFPSLKVAKPKPGELMTNEILDALAQNPSYKRVDVQAEAWKFKEWCERTGNRPLVTSFIKSLNTKL